MEFVSVSVDHNLENVEELQRLKQLSTCSVSNDGYLVAKGPTISVHECHKLQMTRALGHKIFSNHGVLSLPEVSRHMIEEDDHFLLIASDGLWDFLESEEILDIVISNESPNMAVTELCDAVQALCKIQDDVDNMAVVLVHLNV
eukprot:TRINITY_DN8776_c0_g1_i1.p2 TRINITY_DN8776_c0_g1~~TRINITY_DN8776_c0_g1_i1.p2  ORF type:complete len:144 (+),score=35.20 TRINITY_DN8776_c0_g1_i1:622-1053(+)